MSANRKQKIHPADHPSYCVLSGIRSGERGFWSGPAIDVVGMQQVNPSVSRDWARQNLIAEGEVVAKEAHDEARKEIARLRAELEQEKAARSQLEKRLTRVFPNRRRKRATA